MRGEVDARRVRTGARCPVLHEVAVLERLRRDGGRVPDRRRQRGLDVVRQPEELVDGVLDGQGGDADRREGALRERLDVERQVPEPVQRSDVVGADVVRAEVALERLLEQVGDLVLVGGEERRPGLDEVALDERLQTEHHGVRRLRHVAVRPVRPVDQDPCRAGRVDLAVRVLVAVDCEEWRDRARGGDAGLEARRRDGAGGVRHRISFVRYGLSGTVRRPGTSCCAG